MVVPLPFGFGRLVCLAPIAVARDGQEQAMPEIVAALNRAADLAVTPP
jgi:lysophospholipid acyltransferase (LPLAT)-like uncharacterized protein